MAFSVARSRRSRRPNRSGPGRCSARARQGRPLLDLTESNPTRAGFDYPADLLAPLGDPRGLAYEPQPVRPAGRAARRRARLRAARHRRSTRDRIALTASTSEAYSLLFKLLADAGDEVLVPRPSYPLFDHLTRLDELVAPCRTTSSTTTRWTIDLASVDGALDAAHARAARSSARTTRPARS